MDIGTKQDPGRELTVKEVAQAGGGYTAPGLDETPPESEGGGGGTAPVDYSATP